MHRLIPPLGGALLVLVTAASPVGAQPVDCANANTQAAMRYCAGHGLKQSDDVLNRTYAVVMARLSPNGKAALRDAQRAWIAYRDKECFFESNGNDGGSSGPMIANNCAQTLTDRRAKDLANFKVCQEGDLSCPR